MANSLKDLLKERDSQTFATDAGRRMHVQMQRIVIDNQHMAGDENILREISEHPDLIPFFDSTARTEVPVAGYLRGKFVSRRIDRMVVNHQDKTISILDYKSDVDKILFYEKYVAQIAEYQELLHEIYPDYSINGYILWLHDWTLQKIC